MPPGRPIRSQPTFLDRLRAFLTPTPLVVPAPTIMLPEPYVRSSALIRVDAATTATLLTDRAPNTRSLRLYGYTIVSRSPEAKDFIFIHILINGVKVFPFSDNFSWVVDSLQPIPIDVMVPPASQWILQAENRSGTTGLVQSLPVAQSVNLQAIMLGEVLHA